MNERKWIGEHPWTAAQLKIPEEGKGIVARSRLMETMEGGTESFVVLQAEAGFGKTAAMAEYAGHHRRQSCWLGLGETDNDFARFLCVLAASFSSVLPPGLFAALSTEQGARKAAEHSPSLVSERFLEECYSSLPEGGIQVCLDNFQTIRDERIFAFLLRLAECGAGKVRFLLSVQGEFPDFLDAGLMRGRVRRIGAGELRFREPETRLLLEQAAGRTLPEKTAASVQDYTLGWAAGIVFAGFELGGAAPDASFSMLDFSHLYGYIFREIFRKLAYDTQLFLLDSSVFPTVEASVCNYAIGRSDSETMLKYLVRRQLFLSRMEGERESFRYDPPFLDFLRGRQSEERRVELLLAAAECYAKRGDLALAEDCALQCGRRGERKLAAIRERRKGEVGGASLTVSVLGAFSVRGREGELSWRTKKTKELFACLFYEEGRYLVRDVLMERLWPEKPYEKAYVLFHTTASYLRRTLEQAGAPDALVVKNQSYALDMQLVASDMEEFAVWKSRAKAGELPEDHGAALVALYRACYMYGEDYLWLEGYPEQVEREYLALLLAFSDRAMEQEKFADAVPLLTKAAQIDCYNVPLVEKLLECLILCRNLSSAHRHYEALRKVCEEELGQELSHSFEDYVKKAKNFEKDGRC